jgi:hypothetical protein
VINRDPIEHCDFDICLLGECDEIASWLSDRLGWDLPGRHQNFAEPVRVGESHVWAWPGANLDHRWVRRILEGDEEEEEEEGDEEEIEGEGTNVNDEGSEREKEKQGMLLEVPSAAIARARIAESSRESSAAGSEISAGSKRQREE